MSSAVQGRGLMASLRRLLATVLEIAHVRLELLAVELEQEKQRVFDALLWAAIAVLLLGMGLTLSTVLLAMLFWEGHRLLALGVLCVLLIGASVVAARLARARLRSAAGMVSATLGELARDRDTLRGSE